MHGLGNLSTIATIVQINGPAALDRLSTLQENIRWYFAMGDQQRKLARDIAQKGGNVEKIFMNYEPK